MRSTAGVLNAAFVLLVASCGGPAEPEGNDGPGNGGEGTTSTPAANGGGAGGGGSNGTIVNQQPPGQGYASVDGVELTLSMPGGLACSITAEEFAFSFIKDDNAFALGGGATFTNGAWFGSLTLQTIDDRGQTVYAAKVLDNSGGIAVNGNSVSYSGPMERTDPAPPGEIPEPIDVGDGVFSATCA